MSMANAHGANGADRRVTAGYEDRVQSSFDRQQFMATLGARMVVIAPGEVTIAVAAAAKLTQQHGYVHAGVIASIADSACGYAAYTLMPADHEVLSVEFKLNLLAPAVGDGLEARAQVIRGGRTLSVCRADVLALNDGATVHVATMLATMIGRPASQ
jgi:uncharacterized protein (TIGR00369 family)